MKVIKGSDVLKLGKHLAHIEAMAEYFKARAEIEARAPKNPNYYGRPPETAQGDGGAFSKIN